MPSYSLPEKYFRGMIESTAGIPWTVDLSTFQFTYVGPQAETILGYPISEWYQDDFWPSHIHPDDRDFALQFCLEASKKGKDYHFEYRMIHKEGFSVWLLDYVNIVIEDGVPIGLQGFMFDISDKKKLEQEKKHTDTKYKALFDAASDAILLMRGDVIIECNAHALEMFACDYQDIIDHTPFDFSPQTQADGQNSKQKGLEKIRAAMDGNPQCFEWRYFRKNGASFEVEVSLNSLVIEGEILIQAIVRDISERKNIDNAINKIAAGVAVKTGEVFYRQLVKYLADLFNADCAFLALLDTEAAGYVKTISVWNQGNYVENFSYKLTDTPCANVITHSTCYYPHDVQKLFPNDSLLTTMGVDSYIGTPLIDSSGQPQGLLVVMGAAPIQQTPRIVEILEIFSTRAIAEIERENIYRQLEHTEHRLRSHIQKTPLGVIEWDGQGRVTDWNPAAEKIFGFTKQEALGCLLDELIVAESEMEIISRVYSDLMSGRGGTHSINANITKDGRRIMCEWYNTRITADRSIGEFVGVASMVADVTDRLKLEEELYQHQTNLENLVEQRTQELIFLNQELESFSYSVSHDLRAPLRHVLGFSDILLSDYSEQISEEAKEYLQRIANSTRHMQQLIDGLLQLSRVTKMDLDREAINLSNIANNIVNNIKAHESGRKIKIEIQENLHAVADQRLMYTLLENLIGNAWKYTARKKIAEIKIGVTDKYLENDEYSPISSPVYVVQDNGAGFDMQYAQKLFEPFQRLHTTQEFEGTGIGLATVQRIVHRHGGRVWAESAPGEGASFYFTLGVKK